MPSVLLTTRRETTARDYLVEIVGPTLPIISIKDLLSALQSDPVQVESWLSWSDSKRTDSGWYFRHVQLGKFEVGYYPKQTGRELELYSDAYIACANYIKREVESIFNGRHSKAFTD